MNEIIQIKEFSKFSQFYYVNATCHDEFSHSFKVGKKDLPIIIYLKSHYHLYSKFTRKFNRDNINEFLDRVLKTKLPGSKIEAKEIKFSYKNCKKITKVSEDIDYDRLDRIKLGLEDDDNEEELNLPEENENISENNGKVKDEM